MNGSVELEVAASLPTAIYNLNVGQAGFNIAVFPKDTKAKFKPDQANRFVIFDCGLQRENYTDKARENADDFFVKTLKWKTAQDKLADAPVVDWLILSHPDQDHYNYVPWLIAKYRPRIGKVMISAPEDEFDYYSTWVPKTDQKTVTTRFLFDFIREYYSKHLKWVAVPQTVYATPTISKTGELQPFAKFGPWSLYSANPVSWGTTTSPTSSVKWKNSERRNSASIVLVIKPSSSQTARPRIVMTADSNHFNEPFMIKDSRCKSLIEDCDVCKVAHHGSSKSSWIADKKTGTDFPHVAKPKVGAIVSAGAFAKAEYGERLPRMDAMRRWEEVLPKGPGSQYLYFFSVKPSSKSKARLEEFEECKKFFHAVERKNINKKILQDPVAAVVGEWNNRTTQNALYAMYQSWKTNRPVSRDGWTEMTQNNYVMKKGWRIDITNGKAAKIASM